MKKINELFQVLSGTKLDFNKMIEVENGIAFVSRTSKNNGVVGYVEAYNTKKAYEAGLITVSLGGTYLLSSFVQTNEFYTGQNVAVLKPILEMTLLEKLFYCQCILMNRYKYSAFGREANKTLKDLMVPDINEIPAIFKEVKVPDFLSQMNKCVQGDADIDLNNWKEFTYSELFRICGGYYNKKPNHFSNGSIPFIGATRENNGITELYSIDDISLYHKDGSTQYDEYAKKIFKGNCITVLNNGASVGYAFYQEGDFTCSHDVNILYLKNHTLNPFIAMFLITLIEKERYRWNYGRKWRPKRMPDSIIKLPILRDANGNAIKDKEDKYIPDWGYMESFIERQPYSVTLKEEKI